MPFLVMNSGERRARMALKAGVNSLGRAATNDLPIEDASVSSAHCEVVLEGNKISIRDLGSTNGTFVDGQLVTEAYVNPGQMLRLGTVEFRVESDEVAAAKPTNRIEPDKPVFCKTITRTMPDIFVGNAGATCAIYAFTHAAARTAG